MDTRKTLCEVHIFSYKFCQLKRMIELFFDCVMIELFYIWFSSFLHKILFENKKIANMYLYFL